MVEILIDTNYPYDRGEMIPLSNFLKRPVTINEASRGDGQELPDIMDNVSTVLRLQRELNRNNW